ncbi:MAG: retron St85 family RNA-directed DNA polymerase [Desulfobacula sp.]|nr:retron St85 family RNA-directed DNA polymerase [Desulfobacula sp.]
MPESMILTVSQFEEFMESIKPPLSSEDIEFQRKHFEKLTYNKLPYFFNVDHLANSIGFSSPQLHLFISNKRVAYSTFKLPKKNRGFRLIDAPSKDMKIVQRWILDNILYKLNVGEYAHGFVPGKSIATNASIHVAQDLVLGIDLKDFFPSITLGRVIGLFRGIGYNEEIAHALGELCTFNWKLPQGAPTSPMISNLIAWNIDIKLSGFCKKRNLNYSRYADDITISGGKRLPKYKTLIFRKIEEEGFSINWEKVRLHDRGSSQRVTGLVVNDKVTLGRKKKKTLRAIVHNIVKNGPETENRENEPFFKEKIFGQLAFAKMIEPDFADSLLDSLKHVDWNSYDKKLTGLIEGELSVRSLEKKKYCIPVVEDQDIKSETDLLKVICDVITELRYYVEDRRWIDAFWDDSREVEVDGNKIKLPAFPKKETKIQPTLYVFFDRRLYPLGIHVSRETDEGIGKLDFKFMVTTKSHIPLLICAEFKLAHSTKLEHGITVQLPAYLKANRSTSGLFLVMWFKDEEEKFFDKPNDQNKLQMIEFIEDKINVIKYEEEIDIKSILIDASKKPSASNL